MELWILALLAFLVTVILVLWRPGGIHEAIPALLGAFLLFLLGLIDRHDVLRVMGVVWNSAITIIATFIMAAVLEGAGFFAWVGDRLIERANGSGRRLFHLVLAFSACLTLFLNNDGSILLGTPVVLGIVQRLKLPRRAAFAYLIGACLIASASSAPVGVSNMANLEAMSLVGLTLTEHLRAVWLPAVAGLALVWALLYALLGRTLPDGIGQGQAASERPADPPPPRRHPHAVRRYLVPPPPEPPHGPHPRPQAGGTPLQRPIDPPFMWFVVAVVVLVRMGFFAGSLLHIPPYQVAAAGAFVLLAANAFRRVVNPRTAIFQAPWAILGFALGMDLIVFGLRNADILGFVARHAGPVIVGSAAGTAFVPGLLVALVSAMLNNHPGLIIGSLTLLQTHGLTRAGLDLAYAGVVLGSDLGALITPTGTLASLIWLHTLRQHGRDHSWWEYARVTLAVIPAGFFLALCVLYGVARMAGL